MSYSNLRNYLSFIDSCFLQESLHALGRGFVFAHRLRLSVARTRASVDYLFETGFIPAELETAAAAISRDVLDAIAACPPDAPDYAQISLHGDCHGGNVLWRNDCPHFVDFDDCLTGPAMQDLWMLLSGDEPMRQRQLGEIIEGYEMFHDFDPVELRLIEPLRAMRVLNFNAWLASRWQDPAFPQAFPWFNSARYWSDYILELKELLSSLQQPPLAMPEF